MSLYTVQALLILDTDGKRVYSKYFKDGPKDEVAFEKQLAEKTSRVNGDILIHDQRLILYKQMADVLVYVVADQDENECLLYTLLVGLRDALDILLEHSVDRHTVMEHYDRVALLMDEAVDGGIILETDPQVLSSRVTKSHGETDNVVGLNVDISEKGIKNMFDFAKGRFAQAVRSQFQ